MLVFLRKSLYKKIYADLLFDREINQPSSTRDTLTLYGIFQDQGTTCVSRQSDANLFISKRAETLNFFAPLRIMADPIYIAKKSA